MSAPDPAALIETALRDLPEGPVGLAVSGGSDSLAMMVLAAELAARTDRALRGVTVNHGLRAAAADEAAFVAEVAEGLGLPHDQLHWQDWDGQGNLMDQARRARYRLMAGWAERAGIVAVLVAHTQDDLAETLLMRLARGAGVDGLSAMRAGFEVNGVQFLRPLLGTSRDSLRTVLHRRNQAWIDDPSNQDNQFTRVRMRKALTAMAETGPTVQELSQSAFHLAEAKEALNWAVAGFAEDHVQQRAGDLRIAAAPFATLPTELQRRLLRHALLWVSGAGYGPRGQALAALCNAALTGKAATLAGVRMVHRKGEIYLYRELASVKSARVAVQNTFDSRWHVSGPVTDGAYIGPLGKEGLKLCPNWRESGRPAAAHHADPAIWCDNRLISAPLAGFLQGWQADLLPKFRDFAKWLVIR